MSVDVGRADGYLELDTSKFKSGFRSAMSDMQVFNDRTATTNDKLTGLSSAMGWKFPYQRFNGTYSWCGSCHDKNHGRL